jgi:hypothetical protein
MLPMWCDGARTLSRLVLCSILLGLMFGATLPSSARAADSEPDVEPQEHKQHAEHIVFGMKGVSTVERAITSGHEATLSGYGFASGAERSFLQGRLGLELDVVVTAPGEELAMAMEPMIKLPWHVGSWLEPYVATGPMLLRVHDGRGEVFWLGGGQLVLGAFLWFSELAGIDLDIAAGAARGPDMAMTELTVAIGPVLRE